jgi:hypothetical protein
MKLNQLCRLSLLPLLFFATTHHALADSVLVIGHSSLQTFDAVTIEKIFTGKIIEVNGVTVTAVNLIPGHAARKQFLFSYLNQDEDKYLAYWTVRKFIGKGSPPRNFASATDVIDFVQSQPGAIGYIPASELKQGLNILSRK